MLLLLQPLLDYFSLRRILMFILPILPVIDLPPAKRRKGLTSSVISTAFSAALFGAAVGLTVYRMYVALAPLLRLLLTIP